MFIITALCVCANSICFLEKQSISLIKIFMSFQEFRLGKTTLFSDAFGWENLDKVFDVDGRCAVLRSIRL